MARRHHHHVYVVELDAAVWHEPAFRKANPDYLFAKPFVYVGMTGLDPDLRFDRHKADVQSNRYVRDYGLRLLPASLINVPHRDYWLAEPRREASLRRLGAWMAWLAVGMTALVVGVNELVLRANLGRAPLHTPLFLAGLAVFMAFMLGWMVGLYRAFRPPSPR